jgi:hypothetical protein
MTWDTRSVLNKLFDYLVELPMLFEVKKGVPESFEAGVVGYITVAGQVITQKAGPKILQRKARYMIVFAYRVDDASADAEDTMGQAMDALLVKIYADLTLGGTALNAEVDMTLVDAPEYRAYAGQDYRVYPVVVVATQQQGV